MQVSDPLTRIEAKLRQLVAEMELLREENRSLQEDKKTLTEDLASLQARQTSISNSLDHTRQELTASNGVQDKQQLIDQYVAQIDQCIAWLQEQ